MLRRAVDLLQGSLFPYQRRRYRRWKRLSPLGKAWWATRKAVGAAFATVFLSVLYVGYRNPVVLAAAVDGTTSPLALVGPLLAALPVVAVLAVASVLAVLFPSRPHWQR